jgi:mitochondrial intermediate peptidase
MVADFSPEEHAVALIFLRDFERSGIDLPPLQREQFVSLSDEIISLGRQFLTLGTGPKGVVELSMSHLQKSMLPGGRPILRSLSAQSSPFSGKVQIHGGSWEARMLLRYCTDEGVRRDVFVAGNIASNDGVETLEALLRARASVARLAGNESYAAMTLGDKMAKTPGEFQPSRLGIYAQCFLRKCDAFPASLRTSPSTIGAFRNF